MLLLCISNSVLAESLDPEKVSSTSQIGQCIIAITDEGLYLLDNQNNIINGPYEQISDYNQFPYAKNNNGYGVLDYSGKEVVLFKYNNVSFTDSNEISYYYFDRETAHEGIIDPKKGTEQESKIDKSEYFYKALGLSKKTDIAYATIVYEDNKCADIDTVDLNRLLDSYWNFDFKRVIAPFNQSEYSYYIKLWNSDKTK